MPEATPKKSPLAPVLAGVIVLAIAAGGALYATKSTPANSYTYSAACQSKLAPAIAGATLISNAKNLNDLNGAYLPVASAIEAASSMRSDKCTDREIMHFVQTTLAPAIVQAAKNPGVHISAGRISFYTQLLHASYTDAQRLWQARSSWNANLTPAENFVMATASDATYQTQSVVTTADIRAAARSIPTATPVAIPASLDAGHGGTVKYATTFQGRTYHYCVNFSSSLTEPTFLGAC